jgi:hypothetical protein
MDNLNKILNEFDLRRTKMLIDKEKVWDADAVAKCFEPCAKEILLNGYFLVKNKYIIELGSIELYYHEENGPIKDYIMYHRENRIYSKIKEYNKGELPYFDFGSLNLHQSGVDITFENEQEKYRASFLIRAFRVIPKDDNVSNNQIVFDSRSTYIFDELFYSGILWGQGSESAIKWVSCDNKNIENIALLREPRRNVCKYGEPSFDLIKGKWIDNKILNEKDTRAWQFIRPDVKIK